MDTSKIVGKKVQSLRESQSISIDELAQRTGLTIEEIGHIENNTNIPSLAPLIKIARVLGVRLGAFFDDLEEQGPVICRKQKEEDTNGIRFSNNSLQGRPNMEYYSLAGPKANRHMEPFIININPLEHNDFILLNHEGEEFIYVMEGTIEVSYGQSSNLLYEGDSMYFDSETPHHVHAYQGQIAKLLAVIYTPN